MLTAVSTCAGCKMDLRDTIEQNILEHHLLAPGERALVAVSGGVDSVVLLRLLHGLHKKHGWHLEVAHFNHQLRGEDSNLDALFVQESARELNLPFHLAQGNVAAHAAEHGLSIEMAARELRHQFLYETALKSNLSKVLLGHHLNDQVELYFIRLLRGTVGQGLAGMRWLGQSPAGDHVQLARPLLNIPRTEIEALAEEMGWSYRVDETNHHNDHLRNKVRNLLIPFLQSNFNEDLDGQIFRLMEMHRDQFDYLDSRVRDEFGKTPFLDLAPALQRQLLVSQLARSGITPTLNLIEGLRNGDRMMVRPGFVATRDDFGSVRLESTAEPVFNEAQLPVNFTRSGACTLGTVRISWNVFESKMPPLHQPGCERFDADQIGPTATLRYWRPGDRFHPIGMPTTSKLQDLFTNARIPADKRRTLLLAETADHRIFWVEGLRISEPFKISPETRATLEWRWSRDDA